MSKIESLLAYAMERGYMLEGNNVTIVNGDDTHVAIETGGFTYWIHQNQILFSHSFLQTIFGKDYYHAVVKEIKRELKSLIQKREQQAKEKALRPFYRAFHNKGKAPHYHDQQVAYIKKHWRTLYNLLSKLQSNNKGEEDE